jgi:hypothetical protein
MTKNAILQNSIMIINKKEIVSFVTIFNQQFIYIHYITINSFKGCKLFGIIFQHRRQGI